MPSLRHSMTLLLRRFPGAAFSPCLKRLITTPSLGLLARNYFSRVQLYSISTMITVPFPAVPQICFSLFVCPCCISVLDFSCTLLSSSLVNILFDSFGPLYSRQNNMLPTKPSPEINYHPIMQPKKMS